MRAQKSGCGWVVVLTGEAVGDALAIAAFNGVADDDAEASGLGEGEAEAFDACVAAGVGVALGSVVVAAAADFLFEFRFDWAGERELVRASFLLVFLAALLRLAGSGFRLESGAWYPPRRARPWGC